MIASGLSAVEFVRDATRKPKHPGIEVVAAEFWNSYRLATLQKSERALSQLFTVAFGYIGTPKLIQLETTHVFSAPTAGWQRADNTHAHRNAAGLLDEHLPPLCLACGAPATEALPMHWNIPRKYQKTGIFGEAFFESLEGRTDTRPWSVDVPLCSEHLTWCEQRDRQLLFSLVPIVLGVNLGILSLLLMQLSVVEVGNIVTWGLLVAGMAIFFIGLCLGAVYWPAGKLSIRAVRITGDALKLDGVSPKVVDSLNQQWEQRALQGLQEPPPPLARPVKKGEPPFDWQDITG